MTKNYKIQTRFIARDNINKIPIKKFNRIKKHSKRK